jgi:MinD-like ATPase involved in chromosome partitioning or flagellar assembly
MTTVVVIASGKAKVGKSILSTNLAQYLNHRGHRTGLMVAGARQPVWGVEPGNHWPQILKGHLDAGKTIHRDVFGIDLMVVDSCGHTLKGVGARDGSPLDDALDQLGAYAYLIIDLTADISGATLACCLAATATILIVTPDAPALTAGYEWLARLARHDYQGAADVVLNRVDNPVLAQSIYLRIRDLAQKRLNLQTNYWGSLTKESEFDSRTGRRLPLSQTMPQSELLRNIQAIGDRLVTEHPPENPGKPLKDFWRRFLEHLEMMPDDPGRLDSKQPSVFESTSPRVDPCGPPVIDSQVLAAFNTQLRSIAYDLQAIRRLLEAGPAPGAPPRRERNATPSHRSCLDFDAFIGQHQKPEEP